MTDELPPVDSDVPDAATVAAPEEPTTDPESWTAITQGTPETTETETPE